MNQMGRKIRKGLFLITTVLGGAGVLAQADEAAASRICPSSGQSVDTHQTDQLGDTVTCWTGPNFNSGTSYAGARFVSLNPPGGSQGRRVEAYLFATGAACAKAHGLKTIAGVTSPSCAISDTTADGQYAKHPNPTPACDYTSVVYATAWNTVSCT